MPSHAPFQRSRLATNRIVTRALLLPALLAIIAFVLLVPGCGSDAATIANADGGADANEVDSSVSPTDAGVVQLDASPPTYDAGQPITAGDGGIPISAPARIWTWVDFPYARCRDGSAAGMAVNLNPASNQVMLYLQGGGACFNQVSCSQNQSHYGAPDFVAPNSGIFNLTDPANPVKDYSMVYVPYCTGDVHSGNATNITVGGVSGTQQFVGYTNLSLFLERIVPTFPNATEVLLTGESAGGFGAAANYEHVQRAFGNVPVDLLDDSGPPLGPSVVPPCLQAQWRDTWGLKSTFIADCGPTCANTDDYLSNYVSAILATHPHLKAGLVSSLADQTIRVFFGFGGDNCTTLIPDVSPDDYKAALLTFRSKVESESTGFGTYYIDSTQHTWLSSTFTQSVDGVVLRDWVGALLAGNTQQVGGD